MRDLDLIPQEYRERKTAVAQLRRFALLGVTLIVAMVLGHVWLGWAVTEEQQDITRLENGKQQALGMRQNMDRLNERRDLLAKQLDTLDKLRSGPTIVTGFHSIDRPSTSKCGSATGSSAARANATAPHLASAAVISSSPRAAQANRNPGKGRR